MSPNTVTEDIPTATLDRDRKVPCYYHYEFQSYGESGLPFYNITSGNPKVSVQATVSSTSTEDVIKPQKSCTIKEQFEKNELIKDSVVDYLLNFDHRKKSYKEFLEEINKAKGTNINLGAFTKGVKCMCAVSRSAEHMIKLVSARRLYVSAYNSLPPFERLDIKYPEKASKSLRRTVEYVEKRITTWDPDNPKFIQ